MKIFRKVLCLCLVLAVIISCFSILAQAEILTAAMLGAGLIAVAAGAGAIYASASQSQQSLQEWASSRIDTWLGGRSIVEAFGSEYIRMAHGKLVIPAVIYNAIQDMIDEDVENTGVQPGGDPVIVSGLFYGKVVNTLATFPNGEFIDGFITNSFDSSVNPQGLSMICDGQYCTAYIDGVQKWHREIILGPEDRGEVLAYGLATNDSIDHIKNYLLVVNSSGSKYWSLDRFSKTEYNSDVNLTLDTTWEKDVCDVGYQWEGNISGSEADTNIDDLIDTIYKKATADTLGVIGTIEEETPYPPQPTQYPIDDVLDGMDTINNSINDVGEDVTDAIGNLGDAIHRTIGAIRDTVGEVVDGIATGVQTLVSTIDSTIASVIEAIEEGPIHLFRLGLQGIIEVFQDLLERLSGLLGIWHYVVEWFYSISSPFTYFFGVAQNVSYNLILPVYACIAGGIVLAVYKRFGR